METRVAVMKTHRIRTFTLGSGIAIGLAMLALSPSPLLAQTRHRHQAHHSSQDPEAYAMRNAQRSWPNRPLCDDGGYRIVPCDSSGGNSRHPRCPGISRPIGSRNQADDRNLCLPDNRLIVSRSPWANAAYRVRRMSGGFGGMPSTRRRCFNSPTRLVVRPLCIGVTGATGRAPRSEILAPPSDGDVP